MLPQLSLHNLVKYYSVSHVATTAISVGRRPQSKPTLTLFILVPTLVFHLPESASRGKCCSKGSTCCLRRQVGSQGWHGLGIVTRIISKLDRNGFSESFWDCAI